MDLRIRQRLDGVVHGYSCRQVSSLDGTVQLYEYQVLVREGPLLRTITMNAASAVPFERGERVSYAYAVSGRHGYEFIETGGEKFVLIYERR